ncbi:hypothetical protein PR048_025104 [Dryococelus australis]|uniref:Uncharacterized protein n=1 Tax=Dryococelus australis TaxID=614101 RepID=A0ABQ9GQD6_9NEOP|nr:hypothetical protein PR048_025104 [Dryococelus australis]
MLQLLHEDHFWLGKTKSRANLLFLWTGMSSMEECNVCEKYRASSPPDTNITFSKSSKTFLSGLKFCTYPINNKAVLSVPSKGIFCTSGIPKIIIADNIPFYSYERHSYEPLITISQTEWLERGLKLQKNTMQKQRSKEGILGGSNGVPQHSSCRSRYTPSQILMSCLVRTRIHVVTNNFVPKVLPNVKTELDKEKTTEYVRSTSSCIKVYSVEASQNS